MVTMEEWLSADRVYNYVLPNNKIWVLFFFQLSVFDFPLLVKNKVFYFNTILTNKVQELVF